jgi:hypothetical protein
MEESPTVQRPMRALEGDAGRSCSPVKAAGAESGSQGSIDSSVDLSSASYNCGFGDEHSAQFNARNPEFKAFL